MAHFLIYVRRSYKRADAADVSDETQEQVARSLLPGATAEVYHLACIETPSPYRLAATPDQKPERTQ